MYRAVAYAYTERPPEDMDAFLAGLALEFSFDGTTVVRLSGRDITERHKDARNRPSCVGPFPGCPGQGVPAPACSGEIGEAGGIVAEGRDTGPSSSRALR